MDNTSRADKSEVTGFLNRTVTMVGEERRYVLYKPWEYDSSTSWPLIVFLHGAGERGDDGLKPSDVGLGRAIRHHAERFPALAVMPQCPEDSWWDKELGVVDAVMDAALQTCSVDEDRIYLTGLSMGGFGTWWYGAMHPGRFAALLPICGGGRPEEAGELARVPIWAVHGADDAVVPPSESRRMVEAVREAGGTVEYTELAGVGHNSWDAAYGDPAIIRWLFEQERGRRS